MKYNDIDCVIPIPVLNQREFFSREKIIIGMMYSIADGNGVARIAIKHLGECIGRTKTQTKLAIDRLIEKGWIKRDGDLDFILNLDKLEGKEQESVNE